MKSHLLPRTSILKVVLATVGIVCAPNAALGHHSYASYDLAASISVAGTVAKVEWINPHVFLWLYVPAIKGSGYDVWSFEGGSVATLKRSGWTPKTVQAGEKITVKYFPLRDGENGGYFFRVVHADGRIDVTDPHAPGGTQFALPALGNSPK